jgi:hypothetical protein
MRSVGFAVALAGLALVSPASGSIPVNTTLTTSTSAPVVDQPWRWSVTVTSAFGRPLPARMRLQIVRGSMVVGCWKGTAMTRCSGANAGTWIAFTGKRAGVITWPARTVGIKLKFQAIVVSATKKLRLRAPVTVQPKLP